jgi:hypothetical protein
MVLCPHFQRPVAVVRNEVTDRLIDCQSKLECRSVDGQAGVTVVTYPIGCPVFRR